jgi:hypothetical protein
MPTAVRAGEGDVTISHSSYRYTDKAQAMLFSFSLHLLASYTHLRSAGIQADGSLPSRSPGSSDNPNHPGRNLLDRPRNEKRQKDDTWQAMPSLFLQRDVKPLP